ncbi:branched-chain amino acid transport system II carrier protein [Agarivorans gilvus]|uniref:Branched-chain amino acid transport system carrier protein n=1 Tax=Agarivorans gilvus TaxID=680279 RepID=A0ABQ1I1P0_9ALTE|nr:branched-chain amino acid transport system II carrier protein [Agarivorans gilvus]GGB02831.1 branched-chain amino acid transport system carrier protein [Agarivorans gilvus]
MTKQLGAWNTLSLGLMVFAFFLGAGNLIFPPMAGLLAGDNLLASMFGFLMTAVGLPLLGLLAIAKAGGGIAHLGRYLPSKVANLIALAVYLVLVPMFGIPRTCLVAYELGFVPLVENASQATLLGYSLFYFVAALLFILRRGGLIDSVGKVITPLLVLCISIIGVSVFSQPFAEIAAAQQNFADMPFGQGFIDGYNTMDALAALMFGVLMIEALNTRGISGKDAQFSYLVKASLIAAVGLTLFYVVLFYLGATATGVAPEAKNGGQIIVAYVEVLFGLKGQWLLATIVSLACFTTAIGGISSFATYVSDNSKFSYSLIAIVTAACCALVANIGLDQLLLVSIPILIGIYPVAVALIAFNLLVNWFNRPHMAARLIIGVAALFGLMDGLKAAGVNMDAFSLLPGFSQGFAWLLPTFAAVLVSVFARSEKAALTETA